MPRKRRIRDNSCSPLFSDQVNHVVPCMAPPARSQGKNESISVKKARHGGGVGLVGVQLNVASSSSSSNIRMVAIDECNDCSADRGIDALNVQRVNIGQACYQRKRRIRVVMAFTSTKVRCFENTIVNSGMSTCLFINPAIPEIEEYRANFNKPYHAPKFITTSSARHEPAPDYRHEDIINVSPLNLQAGKKDKSLTFICKAKITKFMVQEGWYYLACPTCCKTLRLDHNFGKLCCGNHGEQIGHPIYKMELLLEDEDDSTIATIIGKAANTLFAIACDELVNEKGEDDKYNVPPAIEKARNQYHVWRIGYGIRDDFLVKSCLSMIQCHSQVLRQRQ